MSIIKLSIKVNKGYRDIIKKVIVAKFVIEFDYIGIFRGFIWLYRVFIESKLIKNNLEYRLNI